MDCDKLREAGLQFACCISCHEDYDDFGYDACSVELRGEYLQVCCVAARAMDTWRDVPPPAPAARE